MWDAGFFSNPDPLDFVEVDLVAGEIVELGGFRRFVDGDGLGLEQTATFTQQSKLAKMCPLYLRPLMAATGTLAGGSSRTASPTTEDALPCPS
jgi:hypothetical protein